MAAALLVAFLQSAEGLRLKKYKDSGNKYTIGYGHLIGPKENYDHGITKEQALQLLGQDADIAVASVARLVKVDLSPNEHAAVASWVFNLGEAKVAKSQTLAALNQGDKEKFLKLLLKWDKVTKDGKKVPVKGLTTRRENERLLFLGDYNSLMARGVKLV